jgi:hypothetical protein
MNDEFVIEWVKAIGESTRVLEVRDFRGNPSGVLSKFIPKSVITESSEIKKKGDTGKLIVKRWWARQEGWTE